MAKLGKLTKDQLIRRALHYAILWEQSFIDSMRGCNSENDVKAVEYAESWIEQWQALQAKYYKKS